MMKIINKKRFFISIIIVVTFISMFIKIGFNRVSAKDQETMNEVENIDSQINDNSEEEIVQPQLDNSGYLSLEEDPNADDAMVVAPKILYNYGVEDSRKIVYLTFDDGPSTVVTEQILDVLDSNSIKATFFVLGSSIDKNNKSDKILKRMVKDGHAIGIHSYSHDYKKLYPNRVTDEKAFMGEFNHTLQILKGKLGKDFSTRIVRFPGGHMSWNTETIDPILEEQGITQIDWNSLSGDAEGRKKSAEELKNNVIETSFQKDKIILLMHDTNAKETTVEALQGIIDYYKSQGYEFRTLK